MFNGIIQGLGKIIDFSGASLKLSTNLDLNDCNIGSSISCNGVCLTATDIIKEKEIFTFEVNVGEETKLRSNLNQNYVSLSSNINIEKSLKLGDEISGHFVYGHVDLITKIIEIKKLENSWEYKFEKNFKNKSFYIVEKASIAINGISLTIANVDNDTFTISVIPHTFFNTNLQYSKINEFVNIEFDYLSRFLFKKND